MLNYNIHPAEAIQLYQPYPLERSQGMLGDALCFFQYLAPQHSDTPSKCFCLTGQSASYMRHDTSS